jgi:tRNA(His) guanylyltransferase
LRKQGKPVAEATADLHGKSFSELNEILFQLGTNFNELPLWQRRGTGVYWERFEKPAVNLKTGEPVIAERRRVKIDEGIPMGVEYDNFIRGIMAEK